MLLQVFCLGLFHDVLCTIYLRAVNSKRPMLASLISGLLTAYGYFTWSVMQPNASLGIILYAFGGAIGTYLGLVIHVKRGKFPSNNES